jgi:hypothetical protein
MLATDGYFDQTLVALPWERVGLRESDGTAIEVKASQRQIEAAPSFNDDRWPDLNNPAFTRTVYNHFQVAPYFLMQSTGQDRFSRGQEQLQRDQLSRQFDPRQIQSFSGTITRVQRRAQVSGLSGEEQPVAVELRLQRGQLRGEPTSPQGQTITAYLAPQQYINEKGMQLHENQQIQLRGSQGTINGETAIIAANVSKNGQSVRLRDEQSGRPLWQQKSQWHQQKDQDQRQHDSRP